VRRKYAQFNHRNPTGPYTLDLSDPHARCILRRLCLWAVENKSDKYPTFESCCKDIKWDEAPEKGKGFKAIKDAAGLASALQIKEQAPASDEYAPWFDVPSKGILDFKFTASRKIEGTSNTDMVRSWAGQIKRKLPMRRFAVVLNMFKAAANVERKRIMIEGIAATCLLTSSQFLLFVSSFQEMLEDIILMLPGSVFNADRWKLLDLMSHDRKKAQQVRQELSPLIFFEPDNPTGRYQLHLVSPNAHFLAEQLLTINEWEKGIALDKGAVDTSQYGRPPPPAGAQQIGFENIRNWQLNGVETPYDASYTVLPPLRSDVVVRLDYVSPVAAGEHERVMSGDMWHAIGEAFQNSGCSSHDKLRVLRCFSPKMRLKGQHVRECIRWFPLPGFRREAKTADVVAENSGALADPRSEAYVICFKRVFERSEVISSLFDRSLFTSSEAKALRTRLGWLNTFDVTKVGIFDYNFGARFGFDLAVYEQRRLAQCVLRLIAAECRLSGLPVGNCTYSKSSFALIGGFQPPSEWVTKEPPTEGVLRFDNPRFERDNAARKQLAKEFLGWEDQVLLRGKTRAQSVIWADTNPMDMMKKLFSKLSAAGGLASRVWNQNQVVMERYGQLGS